MSELLIHTISVPFGYSERNDIQVNETYYFGDFSLSTVDSRLISFSRGLGQLAHEFRGWKRCLSSEIMANGQFRGVQYHATQCNRGPDTPRSFVMVRFNTTLFQVCVPSHCVCKRSVQGQSSSAQSVLRMSYLGLHEALAIRST
jgi:hypothetical protein